MKVSVIMPALNEQDNILEAIRSTKNAFAAFGIDGEIIVINDGSTDQTGELVKKAMRDDPSIKLIAHATPRGIGASFWDGVANSDGEVVFMSPGDNENDPEEILRYHRLLEHVDMVIPFIFNREVRSVFRNILSLVYRKIINTTFLVNFNYTNGTILYRKSILKKLESRSQGFFFQTDILVRLAKKNYLFAEVPYKLGRRLGGKSRAVNFPSFVQVVRGYLQLVRDYYLKREPKTVTILSRESATFNRRRKRIAEATERTR